ncbi:MAG: HDOD domain-containing protein, partial [Gemmatimonadaceae bacterium]
MRQILAETDFPAISKDALDALKHMPEDDASIQRLANIVLREYSLTLKVLRTANSAYYKRSEQPIQSAAHAMLLLGARTVRHLAASLLAFEHYRKRSPGLKELMLLSLLTANHARETAMRRGLPDPEEAHLCAMFRNLGEVLIAGYFPAEYARILQHMEQKNRGEGNAAFDVLGFRLDELGHAMALHWGMPDNVLAAIRADGPNGGSSEMSVIAAFSHDLTYAVYRRELDHKRDTVGDVLTRYARRLSLTREQVSGILQAALRETKEVFTSAKVSIDDLRLKRLNGQAMAELGSWSPTPVDGLPTQPSPAALESDPAEIARLRAELTAEVVRVVHPSSGEDLNRVILIVLEGILRGGPFDRVIFCMMTPDRTALKARYGLGESADQVLERFSFELSPREGPIPVAMLRRQSIYVPVERDFTAQELRFAQSLGSSSFGVFPVVVGGRLLGCVFCDRPWNSKLPDKATLAYVRSLCDGAVRGIEARVSGTMATVTARASSGGQPALGTSVARVPSGPQQVVRVTPAYSAAHKSEIVLRLLRTSD